jgi:RimJ/RimL family protein N-acetyltransferase
MTSDPLPPGGLIRKLLPADHAAYREHLLRLDPQSRRSRFSGAVSDEFIRNYAALSRNLDTVIHGFFVDGALRGVAELRPLGDAFAHEAEAAFSIERPWQSHGVGAALLRRTLLSARNRRIRLLYMACLAENKVMQKLARKFDAELKFDFGSVAAHVETPQPTAVSLMRESLADTLGFATAVLDVQARWLKPA